MENSTPDKNRYGMLNFSAKGAFNASSFAEILVEVGKQVGEAQQHCFNRDAEVDSLKYELMKSRESAKVLDQERLKVMEMLKRDERTHSNTVDSLKLERQMQIKRNISLFAELQEWYLKFPEHAKKFRRKFKNPKPFAEDCSHILAPNFPCPPAFAD